VRALQPREEVRLLVRDAAMEEEARRTLAAQGVELERGLRFLHVPTDDAWARDTGPIFVFAADGALRLLDFGFNAWGGKYPPWGQDDAVPRQVAELLGAVRLEPGFVLEGGSLDGNGRGAILTTEACLLNANRAAGRSREQMEHRLARWLGARAVLWLGDGICGDDTDGHVDDVARFVAPDAVVAALEPDASDPNHAPLQANWQRLRAARDADGKPLRLAALPMPPARLANGQRCPASYANFYLANGVALVPTFGAASDARALAVLRECLPEREVVGIPCAELVAGLGAIHCLTQQQPAALV
jgi:agmatine deiminase